ncbi:glycosyltransferase family 2 protein [Lederbergia lenta]|nr:glycosyltransferase family 2 protein [Lederbergia lenta]MEC2323176.1 glycosyltransferase family 2 protein [Lederbergia lenta]
MNVYYLFEPICLIKKNGLLSFTKGRVIFMIATNGQKARDLLADQNLHIINNPSSFFKSLFNKPKPKKVTVITAVYNGENFIRKTIESVISQTIGFDRIQYIIVDDCSTDSTRDIIQEYTSKYKNISLVCLPYNIGSPGTPRNIGIEMALSKYITFLDADDWLHNKGLETLCEILDETNDDYVVGKTIKVESDSQSVIGEYASVMERRKVSPFSIPHFFYHMGPTSRMMKLSLLKEHEIRFPEMRFAEDKLFFCDVFFHATSVSTTTKPIYYVNRTAENSNSLTRTVNVLEKRKSDIQVIEYIKSKNLPIEQEKVALTRLYEYDIVKTFDSQLFVKSEKKEDFLNILRQAVETTHNLRYDFRSEFKTPIYRAAIDLFVEDRMEDFIKLFEWLKKDKNKKIIIKDNLPYYEVPFFNDKYQYIRIPMLARALDSHIIDHTYYQSVEVFGDDIANINYILIRDRTRVGNEVKIDFERTGNILTFKVDIQTLSDIENSLFTFFIRYNDYQLLNIKRILKNQISYSKRNYSFYTSVANNLGLSIK